MSRPTLDPEYMDVKVQELAEAIRTQTSGQPHAPLYCVFARKLEDIAAAIASLDRYLSGMSGDDDSQAREEIHRTFNDADWLEYQALTGVAVEAGSQQAQ